MDVGLLRPKACRIEADGRPWLVARASRLRVSERPEAGGPAEGWELVRERRGPGMREVSVGLE
jgi:hypothetical protein